MIAIIAILAALLLPALKNAREKARRLVCLSNQRQMILLALGYASDHRQLLPPSQVGSSDWVSSFDYRAGFNAVHSLANPTVPNGLGLVISGGMIPAKTAAKLVHCPSYDSTASSIPKHGMNVNENNWWNGMGMSWWDDPTYASKRVVGSYMYRSPSYYWTTGNQIRQSGNEKPADFALYTDSFDARFGMYYGHKLGYNAMYLDGHGVFFMDPGYKVESAVLLVGPAGCSGIAAQNQATCTEAGFQVFGK